MPINNEPVITIRKEDLGADYRIDPEEVTPSRMSRYMELTEPEEVLFDVEKGYWVKFGVPRNMFGQVDREVMDSVLVGSPFVFMTHEMNITDPKHERPVDMENVPTLLMHGFNDGKTWKFSNGLPVADYVCSLNKYLVENRLPKLEFLATCNKMESVEPKNFKGRLKKWGDNVLDKIDKRRIDIRNMKIKDIPESEFPIAQAVGDYMQIWIEELSKIDLITHRVKMTFGSTSEIFGLDDVIVSHQINPIT